MTSRSRKRFGTPRWINILELLKTSVPGFTGARTWDDLQVTRLTGGATNVIWSVQIPVENGAAALIREYGEGTEFLNRVEEEHAIGLLAKQGYAPHIHAVFDGGRIEEFLKMRTCTREDIRHATLMPQIASGVAKVHALQNVLKDVSGTALEKRLREWAAGTGEHAAQMSEEVSFAVKAIAAANSPQCYVHSDLQAYNIMFSGSLLRFIDYEYAFFGPRLFDLGNHFCEWSMQNSGPDPGFKHFPDEYPTEEEKKEFLKIYLAATGEGTAPETIQKVLIEIEVGMMVSHLHWALWGLLLAPEVKEKLPSGRLHHAFSEQSASDSDEGQDAAVFDKAVYGRLRFGEYKAWKAKVSALLGL
eukprot:PhF_6_TR9195/c0_g1_i1/m.14365/K14156/CHK; choline/ethanolamine kinase